MKLLLLFIFILFSSVQVLKLVSYEDESHLPLQKSQATIHIKSADKSNFSAFKTKNQTVNKPFKSDLFDDLKLLELRTTLQTNEDVDQRLQALLEIEQIGGEQVLEIISNGINDTNALVRQQIIEIISRIDSINTIPLLGQILFNESEQDLKLQVMEILAEQNSPASNSILQYFSDNSSDTVVRNWALDLIALQNLNIEEEKKNEEDYYFTIQQIPYLPPEERLDKLQRILLKSDDVTLREEAIIALSNTNLKTAFPIIEGALGDNSSDVRFQAIQVLITKKTNTLPFLGQVLYSDPAPELRAEAVTLIAIENTLASRALLKHALNDPNKEIRNLIRYHLQMDKE